MSRPAGKLWVLAAIVIALFCRAGVWQLDRAKQKQAMLAASARVLQERKPNPLAEALDAPATTFTWAEGAGDFAAVPRLLLDNQMRAGRAGIRLYCLFSPAGASRSLLVDMGWLPLDGQRDIPVTACPSGRTRIRGLLAAPPAAGFRMGPAQIQLDPQTWLATRIDPDQTRKPWKLADALAPRVLKLDPELDLGYARDLDVLPNTLPPQRHLGYAVQWFGLALAVLVIAIVLTLRRRKAALSDNA